MIVSTLESSVVKILPVNAGATGKVGSIPGGGRAPGGGNGNPLQHSCLENPKDRGAWRIPWAEEPGRLQYIEMWHGFKAMEIKQIYSVNNLLICFNSM